MELNDPRGKGQPFHVRLSKRETLEFVICKYTEKAKKIAKEMRGIKHGIH